MNQSEKRRWINFGELIALAALIVSAVGVWIAWKSTTEDRPTRVVEQRQPIPLVLRATVERDGRELIIRPVEETHALESLTMTIKGARIDVGADGKLDSSDVESALKDADGKHGRSVPARIETRYVEMGKDRRASGNYTLRYRWEGGGLLGGSSVRLAGLSRG